MKINIFRLGGFLVCAALSAGAQMTDVLTCHNDNARTGQALHEEILTPANVNTTHFGKLWVLPADGKVDGQPLYAAGVPIPGQGPRNVLFVVTEHDSVYAYNADGTNLFWKVSMLLAGEKTSDTRNCSQVEPEIGITSTPVIDRQLGSNGTMFVVAMSKNSGGSYFQRIHALDLGTGAPVAPAVTVAATFTNHGGNALFNPADYKERSGLLLLNGVVYTAWASHCDIEPYVGPIIGYDEQTLALVNLINITPHGSEGAIWMAGEGLATDTNGNIYFLDANGSFDSTFTNGFPAQGDFGNAFIKLSTAGNILTVADYFAVSTNSYENSHDEDLGSGGALVLPDMVDGTGNLRQLAVGAGKDNNIYLADRTNMGKFSATTNAIYQLVGGALSSGGVFSSPAYFNGTLYYGAVGDYIKAFPFVNARLAAMSSHSPETFTSPGATPSISGNGGAGGIVWASANNSSAVLHAFAATNLARELYNSSQAAGNRDQFGVGNKFIIPTIASARVYVGTTSGVGVFGLLDESTLTPLQQWRNAYFGNPSNVGAGSDSADPAGDGVPNLIKYALGLNPNTAITTGELPTGSIESDGGQNYLALTVNRTATAPDVTYNVEVSSDLLTWDTNTVTLVNTATQLVARDAVPIDETGDCFIRLTVSDP
jgi:hypothetical protein